MNSEVILEYTWWYDSGDNECPPFYVGYLNKWPSHSTQGVAREELEEALFEICCLCVEYEISGTDDIKSVQNGKSDVMKVSDWLGRGIVSRHDVCTQPNTGAVAFIPMHDDINDYVASDIKKVLSKF